MMEHFEDSARQVSISRDAFSSGQVGSKIWLIQLLEKLAPAFGRPGPHTVWIYGGWHGVLGMLLWARQSSENMFLIERIRSFDIDPRTTDIANILNENWVWRQWRFRAFTADCNQLFDGVLPPEYGPLPDVVINTSVEHFADRKWFESIPTGTIVCLQASDFDHEGVVQERVGDFSSDESFAKAYPLSEIWFSGSLLFDYEAHENNAAWKFHRRMIIGVR